jgi:hypothetical protein
VNIGGVGRDPAPISISPRAVSELCALQGIPLGEGDAEAVAAILAEYLQLVATIDAVELDAEAAPPLQLMIAQRPEVPSYPHVTSSLTHSTAPPDQVQS